MRRGERLQTLYAQHFKHRYGGNTPSWQHLSTHEQALWSSVETDLRFPRETIDTRSQTVRIKTRRGVLRIGPSGLLEGLWDLVRRELLTNAQTRRRCGNITRKTLIAWRLKDFPDPVLKIKASGSTVEVWSKTDIDAWLAKR
jgi:hypothetical protein